LKKALLKIQYFANFAHKSGAFSEALENNFQREVTLKSDIKTRWNYQYLAASHFLALDPDQFEKALQDHGCKKMQLMKLNQIDRDCVMECIRSLCNFQEATLRTSGDKAPTITHVLPLTLGLINGLQELHEKQFHANALVVGLLTSMYKRFNGLLQLVDFQTATAPFFVPEEGLQEGVKFKDNIYLLAPFFDPTIKNNWVEGECHWLSDYEKHALVERIEYLVQEECLQLKKANVEAAVEVPALQPLAPSAQTTGPSLMKYKAKPASVTSRIKLSPREEIIKYLSHPDMLEPEQFWRKQETEFPLLSQLARKILCVVASGSPIERVFSVAGNVMRPRRSRMAAKTLSALVFLKCNAHLL
jgi:hypothetical protein